VTRARVPHTRVPRAPVSRPNTSATGRPERPDPCADPPTVTIDPTRVMPVLPDAVDGLYEGLYDGGAYDGADDGGAAATVPRLRSVTPAGGGALGDGRILAAGSALGALGSLGCWLLAARALPPAELGRAVAVVAVVAVAACAARPDRGAALVHRLPAAGRRTGRVVVRSLAAAVGLGAGAGMLLALLVPGPAETLSGLPAGASGAWPGVLLVGAAAAAWAVGGVHDGAVVALDRPWWAVAHVVTLVAGRTALLVAASLFGVAVPGGDLAAAWLAPVLLWALPGSAAVAVLARRHARRVGPPPPARARNRVPRRGAPAGSSTPSQVLGPTAVARLGATLLHHVAPLAVVLAAGPHPGMLFFVAWQVVTAVDLAAVWVLGRSGGASLRRLLATVGPALLGAALLAGPLLGAFGPDYAAATDVLRVLLVGAAFRLVVVHELGEREAAGRAWSSARLHLWTTVPTLLAIAVTVAAIAAVVPTGAGAVPSGAARTVLLPVAAAYVLVQVACAAAVLVSHPARRRARPEVKP
jgi:hypothetical protein